ncbi:hypothetical protein N6H13_20055 [Paenibacillus sp. CC-CFT742]|nr:hypothetical protein [Paenibacillus sp. CC-CFT742]WJH27537.1 hypothetical protein N6H13_20055 [Paenibacillus sp. CC-CFT742]
MSVRSQLTRIDLAEETPELLEVHYSDVPKVRLVINNLNTRAIATLYQAFMPGETAGYPLTPEHVSWLNNRRD